jgi:hypothetical protein
MAGRQCPDSPGYAARARLDAAQEKAGPRAGFVGEREAYFAADAAAAGALGSSNLAPPLLAM